MEIMEIAYIVTEKDLKNNAWEIPYFSDQKTRRNQKSG